MIRKSFGRSVSFPFPVSNTNFLTPNSKLKNKRGSTSLPCRFHPFISQLNDHICDLLTWQSSKPRSSSSVASWIVEGLAKMDRLHSSLDDLLQHPQSFDSLRRCRSSGWIDCLLDDFLRLADAYGSLRSDIVTLKDHQSATHAAIRRGDGASRVTSCVIAQRRVEKRLVKIARKLRDAGRWGPPDAIADGDVTEAELAGALKEVVTATAMATGAVACGLAEVSAGSVRGLAWKCATLNGSCVVGPAMMRMVGFRMGGDHQQQQRGSASRSSSEGWLERLIELEELIGEVERGSERLFRNLVNSRVFLLNTMTPIL